MTAELTTRTRLRRLTGTVRFRTTAVATLVVVAVLVVTAVGLVVVQNRVLLESLDDALEQRTDDLAGLYAKSVLPETPAGFGDDTFAMVVADDGTVLSSSPDLGDAESLGSPPSAGSTEAASTVDSVGSEDEAFRVLARRVDGPQGPAVVYVAGALGDMQESTVTLTASLAIAIPIVAVVLAVLVWWLVGRTLRPVEAIRREVADIGGSNLDRRVPEPETDDEIARLAHTMNGMLDRVEDATQRQQRFVADASHELRSPLTRIRSELEIDMAHPETADMVATQRSTLEETTALQHLVDDLLQLARSDAGATSGTRRIVDLDDIVLRQARRLRDDGRVSVDISGVSAAQIEGDADQLTRAVRNLTDNGARHARSKLALGLSERNGSAVLTVDDDGPGIPPGQRERIFERFARLDDSRSRGAGGTGLGLAITRDIVQRHGGDVVVDPDHHPGTRFVLTMPVAGAPTD